MLNGDGKNKRVLSPLDAPEFYNQRFTEGKNMIFMTSGSRTVRYDTIDTIDDKDSGFYGTTFLNKESGHAIVLLKGMDRPFGRSEGNGRLSFLRDAWTAAQYNATGTDPQTEHAERLYLNARDNPAVKSLEVVGFSLGTLHANHLAAKYGAMATTLSDLGISDRRLSQIFNQKAWAGSLEPEERTMDGFVNGLKGRMISLVLTTDLIPTMFGVSAPRGIKYMLNDTFRGALAGLAHSTSVYDSLAEQYAERSNNPPTVETAGRAPAGLAPVS